MHKNFILLFCDDTAVILENKFCVETRFKKISQFFQYGFFKTRIQLVLDDDGVMFIV